jgi:hypothetical protein
MPITTPPSRVSGNERKPPTMAAASAGMISRVSTVGFRLVMGTMRTPATPARAPPSAQLTPATKSGETPALAALRGFSATAVVARPNVVNRYTAHSTTVPAAAMPSRMGRSSAIVIPCPRFSGADGMKDWTKTKLLP